MTYKCNLGTALAYSCEVHDKVIYRETQLFSDDDKMELFRCPEIWTGRCPNTLQHNISQYTTKSGYASCCWCCTAHNLRVRGGVTDSRVAAPPMAPRATLLRLWRGKLR